MHKPMCGAKLPGYSPCHLMPGHNSRHEHLDGRCCVGQMYVLTVYTADDPNKGIRWRQCRLFAGHDGEHEIEWQPAPVVTRFR